MKRNTWNAFTAPKAVAVVGASDKQGSVGAAVLRNLISGSYKGAVYAVNSKRDTVQGLVAYKDLASIPSPVDLAVIATPATTVPDVIRQCGEAGIPAAIVVSAGFDECGDEGHALAEDLKRAALHGGVRLIGPNCVGLISPHTGLNASFGMNLPEPGSVAFLSQSGALGTAILDWSIKEKVGLSTFVSMGSMVDLGWAEIIDCLADDPRTKSIVIYMEAIGNAREFMSAARELARHKPIIVLKAGRYSEGAKAAMSHTGAMAGSDDVLDAAFDRCGILRVTSIAELFYMAETLSKQPRPRGPRLTIVTNAGGPAVLAADALADEGGSLSDLDPATIAKLNSMLPASWSHGNPIDVLGDADVSRFAGAVSLALQDPNTDSVLAVLTPQAMTDPTAVAKAVAALPKSPDKPILASWMGGDSVVEGAAILREASIPTFPYPDTAARIVNHMHRYGESLSNLYETPQVIDDNAISQSSRALAADILETAQREYRTLLTEHESKLLLQSYNVPTVETVVADTAIDAVTAAKSIGFPVVLKLNSTLLTHKNRVGGVRLNLQNESDVNEAYQQIKASATAAAGVRAFQGVSVQRMLGQSGCELIVGSKIDPQFGPVLLFGTGGIFAEAVDDFAIGLPPLNSTLAARLMRKTRAFKLVKQIAKTAPHVIDELEKLLVTMSRIVLDHSSISEIEINPVHVSADGLVALDARIVVVPSGTPGSIGPSITPYPSHMTTPWKTGLGAEVVIRAIRPEDEPAMVRFHHHLSDTSVYHRYFSFIDVDQRVDHERLSRLCYIDYDRQMALIVEYINPKTGYPEIAGVGRLIRGRRSDNAEFALIISDVWQGQGIGSELLRRLLAHAAETRVERVTADILPDNEAMQHICQNQGFELTRDVGAGVMLVSLTLKSGAPVSV